MLIDTAILRKLIEEWRQAGDEPSEIAAGLREAAGQLAAACAVAIASQRPSDQWSLAAIQELERRNLGPIEGCPCTACEIGRAHGVRSRVTARTAG